jgi:hypothetical protein
LIPGANDKIFSLIEGFSAVNKHTGGEDRGSKSGKKSQPVKKRRSYSLTGFNFYGDQIFPGVDNEINFMPCVITPKIEGRCLASVGKGFVKLGEDKGFKDSSFQRMRKDIFRISDSEEVAQKTGIQKI